MRDTLTATAGASNGVVTNATSRAEAAATTTDTKTPDRVDTKQLESNRAAWSSPSDHPGGWEGEVCEDTSTCYRGIESDCLLRPGPSLRPLLLRSVRRR